MTVTSWLAGVLSESPILTLFVVIGLGFLLGEVSFFGLRFGVAGVLFAGLALGSLSPLVTVPEAVSTLGLMLFVYAMGVNSGRAFFDAFRRRGYRENALAAGVLILGGLVTFGLARMLGLSAPVASGLYCGALTNTPALAAVQERVRERAAESGLPTQDVKALSDLPVLAYSVAYPLGVIGALICFHLVRRAWRVTLEPPPEAPELAVSDFVVTNPAVIGHTIREIMDWQGDSAFVISRIRTGGCVDIPQSDTLLAEGDIVSVVGDERALRHAGDMFGAVSPTQIARDRSELDYRRMFVSRHEVVGKRIRELDLPDPTGRRDHSSAARRPRHRPRPGDPARVRRPRPGGDTTRELPGSSQVLR